MSVLSSVYGTSVDPQEIVLQCFNPTHKNDQLFNHCMKSQDGKMIEKSNWVSKVRSNNIFR
jgi:hypothetical protein